MANISLSPKQNQQLNEPKLPIAEQPLRISPTKSLVAKRTRIGNSRILGKIENFVDVEIFNEIHGFVDGLWRCFVVVVVVTGVVYSSIESSNERSCRGAGGNLAEDSFTVASLN